MRKMRAKVNTGKSEPENLGLWNNSDNCSYKPAHSLEPEDYNSLEATYGF